MIYIIFYYILLLNILYYIMLCNVVPACRASARWPCYARCRTITINYYSFLLYIINYYWLLWNTITTTNITIANPFTSITTFTTATVSLTTPMQERGIRADLLSFTAVISACANSKMWEQALSLFHEMKGHKENPLLCLTIERNPFAIPYYRKKSLTLEGNPLLQDLSPDVVTFNALISACDKGGEWERAVAFLEQMRGLGYADGIYIYIYICIPMHIYIYIHIQYVYIAYVIGPSLSLSLSLYIYIYMYTLYIYTYIYIYMYIHTCIRTYVCI